MGGGMGGGGMGGGMGGMGGGMGGMGGGGMGGMGGGGGGFFSVADDLQNDDSADADELHTPERLNPGTNSGDSQDATPPAELQEHWSAQFSARQWDSAEVRQQVRELMEQEKTEEVIALIQAALRSGQSQSWMYETLGIAMELAGRPKSEIERVVMSACDFSSAPEELMLIAQFLSRIGLDQRACEVYRQVTKIAPTHQEAFALALRAAQRADDQESLKWATLGILSRVWPAEERQVYDTAVRIAKGTLEELRERGEDLAADDFERQVQEAAIRDVVIRATWTGEADIDLIVEEPGGTVCSLQQPRTSGGGMILGDAYAQGDEQKFEGIYETYVCAEGFPGTYRARVRKVSGEVVAGKVTVDVVINAGTEYEKHERRQIEVFDDKDALVVFELESGRRTEPLAEEKLEVAVRRQQQVNQAVLAQQLSGISDPRIIPDLSNRRRGRRLPFLRAAGAVGFQPVIITLPEGTQLFATGVVSADRRYVRITASPSFTGIGDVQVFTFAGAAGGGQGGGGGFGGGGGGFGGGGI